MAVKIAQFESSDILGATNHYNGTVGTTAISIPTVAGNPIAEFYIECLSVRLGNVGSSRLSLSLDNGTTFKILDTGQIITGTIRGGITQLKIKANQAGVLYEIILNTEAYSAI